MSDDGIESQEIPPMSEEQLAAVEAEYDANADRFYDAGLDRLASDIARQPDPIAESAMEAAAIGAARVVQVFVEKVEPTCEIDAIATAKGILKNFKARISELEAEYKTRCLAWIDEHGGADIILSPEVRLRATNPPDTKLRKDKAAEFFNALLDRCGGDVEILMSHFASEAFKLTPCRETLGAKFDDFFETTHAATLKQDEPTKKQLVEYNTHFMRKPFASAPKQLAKAVQP